MDVGRWCSVSLKNLNKLSWTQKSNVGPALVLEFLLSDQRLFTGLKNVSSNDQDNEIQQESHCKKK